MKTTTATVDHFPIAALTISIGTASGTSPTAYRTAAHAADALVGRAQPFVSRYRGKIDA